LGSGGSISVRGVWCDWSYALEWHVVGVVLLAMRVLSCELLPILVLSCVLLPRPSSCNVCMCHRKGGVKCGEGGGGGGGRGWAGAGGGGGGGGGGGWGVRDSCEILMVRLRL